MMLTTKEAAARLNCNPATIRRWCRDDRIPWTKSERKNGYLIDETIISGCRLYTKGNDALKHSHLETIGERLFALRNAVGKTIGDVTSDVRMAHEDLSKIEKDKKRPSLLVLMKLAKYYGVTTDYLLCMDLYEEDFQNE